MQPDAPIPRSAFPLYLASSSAWMAAISLQGFLLSWVLVGVLELPGDQVGYGRALIEVPALFLLILGGLLADRVDGRTLLQRMHLLIGLPSLALAICAALDWLHFAAVLIWGLSIAALQAASDPARQAMLSRVAIIDVQRTVTIMTIVTSLVGLLGVWIGGQLEAIGLIEVLVLQATLFAVGAIAVHRLPPMPVRAPIGRPDLLGGLRSTWQLPLIRNVIGLNFLSSLFNAGAYIVAVPFIVKEVYGGGAEFFANVVIVFTIGSIGSNVMLLRFMPLAWPGRLFLVMQITRVAILALLYVQPSLPIFYATILAWGLNMGVTTTLVRTTVQELAPESHRAQILSVLLLSFMVSAPISSMVLGNLIAGYDPLTALLPGIAVSLLIFVIGVAHSGLWQYRATVAG